MTCEAFILHRNVLPSSYLDNYISYHSHFSLKELIFKYHQSLKHSKWWVCNQYLKTCIVIQYNVLLCSAIVCNFFTVCQLLSHSITPTGIQPIYPQSCSASLALLPSSTSSQPSILTLSLRHRHLGIPSRPCRTWSFPIPRSWWCASFPAYCHRIACKSCSGNLYSPTQTKSAFVLRIMWLPTYYIASTMSTCSSSKNIYLGWGLAQRKCLNILFKHLPLTYGFEVAVYD